MKTAKELLDEVYDELKQEEVSENKTKLEENAAYGIFGSVAEYLKDQKK